MSKLQETLEGFRTKALKIKTGSTKVHNRNKEVATSKSEVEKRLNSILPKTDQKFFEAISSHFTLFERYLHFSSTPSAFKKAWDLRSEQLLLRDADEIVSHGAQLIPTTKGSGIFEFNMKGLILSPMYDGFLLGVRHSEGNYDDQLDDLGRFTYQPPEDLLGMLRYRFFEYLTSELKIPYILFVTMWFDLNNSVDIKYKDKLPTETNWVFVVCPVKVISNNEPGLNINAPLNLQLITRKEASDIIAQYKGLSSTKLVLKFRPELRQSLAAEFSYEHVKSSKKGKAIKEWSQENGKKCPGCTVSFDKFKLSDLTFGHIISQDWGGSFNFLNDKIHDPDNLYLTCRSCNSALNKYFPDRELQSKIASPFHGTIGDWIRDYEVSIRNRF